MHGRFPSVEQRWFHFGLPIARWRVAPPMVWIDLVEGWGKVRRFFMIRFMPTRVSRQMSRRRGQCVRCGACCKLLFKCPFLKGNHCIKYAKRAKQCALFPMSPKDLKFLEHTCGFYFEEDRSPCDTP